MNIEEARKLAKIREKAGEARWDAMLTILETMHAAKINPQEARGVLNSTEETLRIGKMSTPPLFEKPSLWLAYVEARYGLDTRAMAESLHSEFTETVNRTQNISERQRSAGNILTRLYQLGMTNHDNLEAHLAFMNKAGNGIVEWETEITPHGTVIQRAKLAARLAELANRK